MNQVDKAIYKELDEIDMYVHKKVMHIVIVISLLSLLFFWVP